MNFHDSEDLTDRMACLLRLQAEAIAKVALNLDSYTLREVVRLLYSCEGKVVMIGMGKSGIVAKKIAATLTSTGTSAIHLHPCDALHGDMGIVSQGDVAMILSNSGETTEITALLPSLKVRKVPVVAIVGRKESTLSHQAKFTLEYSIDRESCPLNLAPTASTSVALAIGDALAMLLMEIKGVTSHDFALNHPAGSLGKRLTLKVEDIINLQVETPVIDIHACWFEIIKAISMGGRGAVGVTDNSGCLVGIITDGDLRRAMEKIAPTEISNLKSSDIMTNQPVTIEPSALAYDALKLMQSRESPISILPVVDRIGRLIGMIQLYEITKSGLR